MSAVKKAILFDLDGTMWDTVPQLTEVYNQVLSRNPAAGHLLTEGEMRSFMGKNRAELAAAVFPLADASTADRLVGEGFEGEIPALYEHPGTPFPHLRETLAALSEKYALAVVSNCQNGYIEVFFETLGVGGFFCDKENAETGLSKGENIRLVVERGGFDRAIYVGDTLGDMIAADTAGLPFVHAAYGFGKPDRETLAIQSLAELPALAARLLDGDS